MVFVLLWKLLKLVMLDMVDILLIEFEVVEWSGGFGFGGQEGFIVRYYDMVVNLDLERKGISNEIKMIRYR